MKSLFSLTIFVIASIVVDAQTSKGSFMIGGFRKPATFSPRVSRRYSHRSTHTGQHHRDHSNGWIFRCKKSHGGLATILCAFMVARL